MALAVKYLVIKPSKNMNNAIFYGAMTGLVSYGLYNFTNYATFTNWTLAMTIKDLIWGITVFTIVSSFTWHITKM
jgi:uncharacterized membrane protein